MPVKLANVLPLKIKTRPWKDKPQSCRRYSDCLRRKSAFESLPIPKGLCPKAQGCEERATLGNRRTKQQPQRGCDPRCTLTKAETPLGFCLSDPLPQGSSFLATLGFVTESHWDSRKRHSSK